MDRRAEDNFPGSTARDQRDAAIEQLRSKHTLVTSEQARDGNVPSTYWRAHLKIPRGDEAYHEPFNWWGYGRTEVEALKALIEELVPSLTA